tara:strand:+ start:1581 stop:2675 length:1095 start_codon:yes stop_codon:yes gene_type:complete
MNIPFLNFEGLHGPIREDLNHAFLQVLDSNWLVMGESLSSFEKEYAEWNKVKHCVGTSNGLDALTLSLRALGVSKDDEVIVPSNTYIASVLAVTNVGATPVFVEPRLETANINPDLIEAAITSKTKALMPVHLYGQACEMEEIMRIANNNGLFVIEDNAQSHGARHNGKMTGSIGHINATSFYPGKNLGALGDGGAITTDDDDLAEKVRTLRNYGSSVKYENKVLGYNNRLDELQAAFLRIKLRRLNSWTKERQEIGTKYSSLLRDISGVELMSVADKSSHSYHLYVIRTSERNRLQEKMTMAGIGSLIHYPIPPHLQECYKYLGYKKGDFPIAEKLSNEVLSLPLFIGMNEKEIQYIANVINS